MFDFSTAVGYEYLGAALAPIWGGFGRVRETALQAERGRSGGMILMQVKFRAALLPPESLPRRAKPAAIGYYEEYEKGSKYEQLKKTGVNHAFQGRKRRC